MTEQQNQKQQAIDLLESRYRGMENVCEGIDMRLRLAKECPLGLRNETLSNSLIRKRK